MTTDSPMEQHAKDEWHDPEMPFHWVDGDGQHHWITEDHAYEILRWFYDEWPGGFEEVRAAKKVKGA